MKLRMGFVSNSSSASFLITNKTDKTLPLVEFVKDNPQLVEDFRRQYSYKETDKHYTEKIPYTQKGMVKSAKKNNVDFESGQHQHDFGDEDYTLIGQVFDYILREGGESERFAWVCIAER